MSLEEENKAVVQRFIDAYNERNLDIFDELVSVDYIDHTHQQEGLESFRQLFKIAFEAFPDWHEEIEDMIAEGEMVWVRVNATGVHSAEWSLFGVKIPPTGKKLKMKMVFIWRLVDGQLAEGWEVDNDSDFLRQLGILKYTQKGEELADNGF